MSRALLMLLCLLTLGCDACDKDGQDLAVINDPVEHTSVAEDVDDEVDEPEPDESDTGYTAILVENGGTVRGRLIFEGTVAKEDREYEYSATPDDMKVCGAEGMAKGTTRFNARLQLGKDNGLGDVIVWLAVKKGKKLEPRNPTVDNFACEFRPRVQVCPVTAKKILFTNSDATKHNSKGVFTSFEDGEEEGLFAPNIDPGKQAEFTDGLEQQGVIRVTCTLHYWMEGFIIVLDHPYHAKTGSDGAFELTDVPAGEHEMHFWHAGYKIKRQRGKMVGYEPPHHWKKMIKVEPGKATDLGDVKYR